MSQDEETRRTETAFKIFEDGATQNYYKYVINENVEQAASIIDGISQGGHNPHQDLGRELISSLQDQFRQKLGIY